MAAPEPSRHTIVSDCGRRSRCYYFNVAPSQSPRGAWNHSGSQAIAKAHATLCGACGNSDYIQINTKRVGGHKWQSVRRQNPFKIRENRLSTQVCVMRRKLRQQVRHYPLPKSWQILLWIWHYVVCLARDFAVFTVLIDPVWANQKWWAINIMVFVKTLSCRFSVGTRSPSSFSCSSDASLIKNSHQVLLPWPSSFRQQLLTKQTKWYFWPLLKCHNK